MRKRKKGRKKGLERDVFYVSFMDHLFSSPIFFLSFLSYPPHVFSRLKHAAISRRIWRASKKVFHAVPCIRVPVCEVAEGVFRDGVLKVFWDRASSGESALGSVPLVWGRLWPFIYFWA